MRQKQKQFDAEGVQLVLVGLGSPQQAETFRQAFDLSFPIICDPDRRLYQTYGLKRTGLLQLARPSLLFKGVKALSNGHAVGIPRGDIYQLPGVVIIDTVGRIRYAYYGRDPADHAPIADIFVAVSQIKDASKRI